MLAIMAAHRIPYAATATVAFPDDLAAKVSKAKSIKGTKFLHVLAPCPPGWKIPSDRAIRAARLAVMARVFPLLEVERGTDWRITLDPGRVPLEDYLKEQGRFRFLLDRPEALEAARAAIDERWQQIINRTGKPLCG
jgi:pyruvate/2-oxoacid:ferredoxin oxidoreductase beta subunit